MSRPPPWGGGGLHAKPGSDDRDRGGLRTLLALADLELDARELLQAAEAIALDFGVVHEDVAATVVGSDEAEPLFEVEPLHSALNHKNILQIQRKNGAPPRCSGSRETICLP